MSTTGSSVVFKKGNFANLPSWAEPNVLLFVEDQGRLFKGNGFNQPLTEFTNILSGYLDEADLITKHPAIRGKIYLTADNKLFTYDGTNYVSVGGGSQGTLDHMQLSNRNAVNSHPISAITGLTTELTNLSTKINDIRFRGFYSTFSNLPTSVSTNRNGDVAVTLDVDGNYVLYVWNSTVLQWEQLSMGGKNGTTIYEKTTDPQVIDDLSQGYTVGDIWINSTTKVGFVCADNALGGAEWKLITLNDLSAFTTDDLATTSDKQYVTSTEKNNLLQLQTIIDSQNNLTNQLNSFGNKMPNDSSSSNKVVSTNTMNNKLANMKIEDLANVPTSLNADAFLVVDDTGTRVVFRNNSNIDRYVDEVVDKNGTSFLEVQKLKFANLQGDMEADGETLRLTAKMYTTDILDMPTAFELDKVLVSNPNTMSYELKSIDELALLQENFNINITDADANWLDPTSTTSGKYEYVVHHGLDSLNIIAMFYDTNNVKIDVPYQITTEDEIIIMIDTPLTFRAVVNCSQGTSSEQLTQMTRPQITASDFMDDIRIRTDKTYSSQKIEDIINVYAKKDNVYTKVQSDSIYASKSKEHGHTDIQVLNKLQEDADGDLTFNGTKLMTQISAFHYEDHWVNEAREDLSLLVDMRNIYSTMNFTTIVNSEITIKNLKPFVDDETTDKANALNLVVMDGSIKVLDVEILPQDVQKYLLGISPNLQILVKGSFDANLYVGAF